MVECQGRPAGLEARAPLPAPLQAAGFLGLLTREQPPARLDLTGDSWVTSFANSKNPLAGVSRCSFKGTEQLDDSA